MEEQLIGSTFKGLAKLFVTIEDIESLKRNNIDRLKKMDNAKFQKKYAEVYAVIKDLPAGLKSDYGVSEHMTREEAIECIKSLDKARMYSVIDAVPNALIVSQFKLYFADTKQKIEKSNMAIEIGKLWNKIIERSGKNDIKKP